MIDKVAWVVLGICIGLCNTTEARSLHRRATEAVFTCTFEDRTICTGEQYMNDDFDWSVHKGTTSSNAPKDPTGPPLGAYSGEYYMYIETSKPRKEGDKAIYLLPSLPADDEDYCVEFAYNMNGHHINTLQLVQMTNLESATPKVDIIWERYKKQGAEWRQAQVSLTVKSGFRLAFIGVAGNDVLGDIALDDITVTMGSEDCGDGTSETTTTTSTTTTPSATTTSTTPATTTTTKATTTSTTTTTTATPTPTTTTKAATVPSETTTKSGPTIPITPPPLPWNTEPTKIPITSPPLTVSPPATTTKATTTTTTKQTTTPTRIPPTPPPLTPVPTTDDKATTTTAKTTTTQTGTTTKSSTADTTTTTKQPTTTTTRVATTTTEAETTTTARTTSQPKTTTTPQTTSTTTKATTTTSTTTTTTVQPDDKTRPEAVFNCSFEDRNQALCRGSQYDRDDFDWTVHSGRTPSDSKADPTGPEGAYDGQYYIYIEASKPRQPNDTAVYLLPDIFSSAPSYCVEFAYSMNGHHINTLQLVQMTNLGSSSPTTEIVWAMHKKQEPEWHEAYVPVAVRSGYRLAFVGVCGAGVLGDIAVDDIVVSTGECSHLSSRTPVTTSTSKPVNPGSPLPTKTPTTTTTTRTPAAPSKTTTTTTTTTTTKAPAVTITPTRPNVPESGDALFKCSFEDSESGSDHLCSALQASTDDMDWMRHKGMTPSGQTGPQTAYEGEYYVYMEATDQFQDAVALLNLPSLNYAGPACVRFAYSMYGHHISRLDLVKRQERSIEPPVSQWSREKSQGEGWHEAEVTLNLQMNDQIGLLATRGSGYAGDIAVDALHVTRGACSAVAPGGGEERFEWTCSFEDEQGAMDDCGIEQLQGVQEDTTDWMVQSRGTNTAHSGEYFALMEYRGARDTAILRLPALGVVGRVCVELAWSINTENTLITVATFIHPVSVGKYVTVDYIAHNTEDKFEPWRMAHITVELTNPLDQIGLVGLIIGEGIIGIDSIRITSSCNIPGPVFP